MHSSMYEAQIRVRIFRRTRHVSPSAQTFAKVELTEKYLSSDRDMYMKELESEIEQDLVFSVRLHLGLIP